MLSFISLLTVCAFQVRRVESHMTKRDMYLVGPVIAKRNTEDWMQCLIACSTTNDCVSYNFEPRSGTCELLGEGLDLGRNCHGRKFLVSSQGWIFHQITDTFWTSWSQWTRCADLSDGPGQTRKRACISSSNGECSGRNMEGRLLDWNNCPKGSHWSSWNPWSTCECINGVKIQTRERRCLSFGNSSCIGEKGETTSCSDPSLDCGAEGST